LANSSELTPNSAPRGCHSGSWLLRDAFSRNRELTPLRRLHSGDRIPCAPVPAIKGDVRVAVRRRWLKPAKLLQKPLEYRQLFVLPGTGILVDRPGPMISGTGSPKYLSLPSSLRGGYGPGVFGQVSNQVGRRALRPSSSLAELSPGDHSSHLLWDSEPTDFPLSSSDQSRTVRARQTPHRRTELCGTRDRT
jgi:hypothetical protein